MKSNKMLLLLSLVWMLMACENPMTLETVVHEDGTLDKTITFEKADSVVAVRNIFGIDSMKGWAVTVTPLPREQGEVGDNSKSQYKIQFRKSFSSVDPLNKDLDTPADTLFHINATLEKKFRWFYTYLKYTEVYRPVNRFKKLSPDDYLNQEDRQFIDRLPAEGMAISKADSLYLQLLNVKIGENFANMAIFNEEYEVLTGLVQRSNLDKKWLDTLAKKKEFVYNHINDMKGEPDFALMMADSLHIPLDRKHSTADAKELSKELNSRVSFMGFANDGKYVNRIQMPWSLVKTNADSISGNTVVWRPLVTKFLFQDYTMYAEARRLNVWALVVSGVVIVLTFIVWRRRT